MDLFVAQIHCDEYLSPRCALICVSEDAAETSSGLNFIGFFISKVFVNVKSSKCEVRVSDI